MDTKEYSNKSSVEWGELQRSPTHTNSVALAIPTWTGEVRSGGGEAFRNN